MKPRPQQIEEPLSICREHLAINQYFRRLNSSSILSFKISAEEEWSYSAEEERVSVSVYREEEREEEEEEEVEITEYEGKQCHELEVIWSLGGLFSFKDCLSD